MDAYVLVDYDNLTAPFQQLTLSVLASRARARVDGELPTAADVYVRLYGGWYGGLGLTSKGTRLAQEIQSTFPLLQATPGSPLKRTFCEIASGLLASRGHVLHHTFRERPGIRSRLSFAPHQDCKKLTGCSAADVARWSRGQCPEQGCAVTAEDVFKYHEQKLVDTLLCCDLIALASRTPATPVFVVSDDDDMIPAFMMAGLASSTVWQLQVRQLKSRPYALILQQHNIRTARL